MSYSVTIRQEAEQDLASHFNYYEEIRTGLGHDFLLCVEEALEKIQRNPEIYHEVYKGLRRIPVRRFPYRLFFLTQDIQIIVTAVFHVRKNPETWEKRSP